MTGGNTITGHTRRDGMETNYKACRVILKHMTPEDRSQLTGLLTGNL
jgi:hypothetical protein